MCQFLITGFTEKKKANKVEYMGFRSMAELFKKIAPQPAEGRLHFYRHPVLWSNKPNLSSAFRLSQRSVSLRGSRVTSGANCCFFR